MNESALNSEPQLEAPRQLGVRDWWGVLKRLALGIGEDNISLVAAGCAFYALLALVPGLTALALLYGLVADPAQVQEQMAGLAGVVPAELRDILSQELTAMAGVSTTGLSWGLVVSVGLALWYASAAMKSLLSALNIALHEEERRGFILFNLVGLGFTLLGILAMGIALFTIVGIPAVLSFLGLETMFAWLVRFARWPILALFVIVGLAALYRFGPCRAHARWRWISHGAVLATFIWLAASAAFSLYVTRFGDFNATYGSLGAIVVVLFWLYISMFVVLVGARLNGELEHATAVDTTTGPERPLGRRGAYFADHVAHE